MKKGKIELFILKEENQMTIKSHKVQKMKQKKPLRKKKIFKWGAVWSGGRNWKSLV